MSSCLIFWVFFSPCLCGQREDLASFPFGTGQGDASRVALPRCRCLRPMGEAWPCSSCNSGFDSTRVAGAQPALPFVTDPDAISLFLPEKSHSLCPNPGREETNTFSLESVSSLLVVQLSWSCHCYGYVISIWPNHAVLFLNALINHLELFHLEVAFLLHAACLLVYEQKTSNRNSSCRQVPNTCFFKAKTLSKTSPFRPALDVIV